MGLSAGRLNRRITIMRKTQTAKPKGGYTEAWAPIDTVWAEVIGVSGREALIGDAFQGVAFYRITIRYRAEFDGGALDAGQISYGTQTLNIRSVNDPEGAREQLLVLADTGSVQKMT